MVAASHALIVLSAEQVNLDTSEAPTEYEKRGGIVLFPLFKELAETGHERCRGSLTPREGSPEKTSTLYPRRARVRAARRAAAERPLRPFVRAA